MGLSKPILFVGEARGAQEAKISKSFVGPSGIELLRMLDEAGVISLTADDRRSISAYYNTTDPRNIDAVWSAHPEVARTNVFNFHPPANDLATLFGDHHDAIKGYPKLSAGSKSGWIRAEFARELERLGDEILYLDPNLIIALGNTALWALAGRGAISKVRGTTCLSTHTVSGYKLLCAYHPAAVVRQWELRPVTIIDLMKAPHENSFPEVRRPNCEIWIEPSIEDIERFIAEHIRACRILAVDIETSGQQITCIGFAPRQDLALVVPIHDERTKGRSYWPSTESERLCWGLVRSILEDQSIPKTFQNGLYDIAFLLRAYGIRVLAATEDTMLLHHALQPEALKGLAYLGSVYTNHGPWKSERKVAVETIKRDA